MTGGYAGKILRINLTKKSVSTIDTAQYEQYGGGHGIGSAVFWDLVADQLPFGAFDPRNVITVMAGPFSGVLVPAGGGRCEVQGLAPQSYPVEWFTRSNFGGRFSTQLKYAGWDGIAIEGAVTGTDDPVWVNIINDKVTIESAKTLWGLDIAETQEEISRRVIPGARFGEWAALGDRYTTQIPAVLCIGPAGENKVRFASLIHGAGSGAGQGGFGGVWGSKKLKAISVIGTGGVSIGNPKALVEARMWYRQFQWDVDNPRDPKMGRQGFGLFNFAPGGANTTNRGNPPEPARYAACASCTKACRQKLLGGIGNESTCADTITVGSLQGTRKDKEQATDLMQGYGLNAFHIPGLIGYVNTLYKQGVLGPGKKIDCDLPMSSFGKPEFFHAFLRKVALREGIGNVLAEGLARASESWGRFKDDTDSGLLNLPYWGYTEHYDPRAQVEWSYSTILSGRDVNAHGFNHPIHAMPESMMRANMEPYVSAEQCAEIVSSKMVPYAGDPFMLDYSEGPTGIYSDNKVKQVAWYRHYKKFWLDSVIFCDWIWPLFFTANSPDKLGPTPEGETKFFNAVTGKNISFADGMEMGRRIWNLDRSIWTLQGRHRDMEAFADYVYNTPSKNPYTLPAYENGKWSYSRIVGRKLDRQKFEDWKTRFYNFEGWNAANGWPTRKTLEGLGMKKVADQLESKNKLG
jgi:aldehyde:ferredoxin oxidoreductase